MGIGNVAGAVGAEVELLLITPHGDWKRLKRCPDRRELGDQLITPHGDWKPLDAWLAANNRVVSLPLMGIGNL